MTALALDAEALYLQLLASVRSLLAARPAQEVMVVGVWSGGAWLAERLHRDLGLPGGPGTLSIALHRDDFAERGLSVGGGSTKLGQEVNGRHVLLVDDVLYTGRTIRAALNELFDFGRPASVQLAVLVDRGGRELPVEAACAAARTTLPAHQRLSLARGDDGRLTFAVQEHH